MKAANQLIINAIFEVHSIFDLFECDLLLLDLALFLLEITLQVVDLTLGLLFFDVHQALVLTVGDHDLPVHVFGRGNKLNHFSEASAVCDLDHLGILHLSGLQMRIVVELHLPVSQLPHTVLDLPVVIHFLYRVCCELLTQGLRDSTDCIQLLFLINLLDHI